MDWYARLMLTVIAGSLAAMAVNDFREAGPAGGSGAAEGRYVLTPMPMARMLLRFDSETGQTWKALFPDIKVWTPIADSLTEMLDQPGEPSAPPVEAPPDTAAEMSAAEGNAAPPAQP